MTIDSLRLRTTPYRARLMEHLQAPLLRNGYALVFNSVATSALGMLYWMLAANVYSAEVVGINAALINAMLFLAQAAQLNLTNGVNRFLPVAGERTTRFVLIVYAIILAAVPIVCLVYFVGIRSWAPLLDTVFENQSFAVGFVLATMAWCIFAMQDSVLIGMRQATWVPLENLIFASAKIVLLFAVATLMPQFGIFFSWVVSMAILLLPVNWFIFRQLAPKHVDSTRQASEPLAVGSVVQYVAGDYLGSLVWTATIGLLPLLILERVGATEAAYFSIAWTIAYSLYLVSRNMGMSLISEASLDRNKLAQYSQRTLLHTFRLLLPVTLFVVFAAPWLLRLFGRDYSSEATTLLRLLALSALPAVITSLYVSVARVQRRVMVVFGVQLLLCGLVFALSLTLLSRIGITGVGWAWLVAQSFVATLLLLTDFKMAVTSKRMIQYASSLRQQWSLWCAKRRLRKLSPLINAILGELKQESGSDEWQMQQILPTFGDVTVVTLGPLNGEPAAMLKFPCSAVSLDYSQRQQQAIESLHAKTELGGWRNLLPQRLLADRTLDFKSVQSYRVESVLPGVAMETLLNRPALREKLVASAAEGIGHLHAVTASPTVINAHLLHQWIEEPLLQLRRLYGKGEWKKQQAITNIGEVLTRSFQGRTLATGWVHGDFAPCNILFAKDGSSLTGIVDWENALSNDLPLIDIIFLLIATRMQVEKKELGFVITELMSDRQWSESEAAILDKARMQLGGEAISDRSLILFTWLRQVSVTIDKCERYRNHTIWRRNNIDHVLAALLDNAHMVRTNEIPPLPQPA